jgi:hypothetical protein
MMSAIMEHQACAEPAALDDRVPPAEIDRLAALIQRFVVVSAVDISSEKRREALERCFMHDVANTVSGICLAAEPLGRGLGTYGMKLLAECAARTGSSAVQECRRK